MRFNRCFFTVLFLVLVLVTPLTAQEKPSSDAAISRQRLSMPGLSDTILGALAYLEDTQIRNRPGKNDFLTDTTDEGDGSDREIHLNLPWKELVEINVPSTFKAANVSGEWASHVHFLPKRTGFNGRTIASVQDSNMFITVFVSQPLFLFDDTSLPTERRIIDNMLHLAWKNVAGYKRGEEYNFWRVVPGVTGKSPRVGPYNIQVPMLQKLGQAYISPKFEKFFALLSRGLKTPPKYWLEQCLDTKLNPTGADALFNIPNDADDTSTAVAFQRLYAARFPQAGRRADRGALSHLIRYRDLNRTKEDGRDTWKGKNTGAFLTWLRDENQPTFSVPEIGIIPLGVNNVDSVVNANVVFSLALNDMKTLPGYRDAVRLVAATIEKKTWPEAGLYYPQLLIFPYTATRAWRDGGAREPEMRLAMSRLLIDLLDLRDRYARENPDRRGAFPGGEDRSDHLSTALGMISLINIGSDIADQMGVKIRYNAAIDEAARYLIKVGRETKPHNKTTAERLGRYHQPRSWDSGLFFAASFWDLGHWRSQPFTVAMVLEALTKYVLLHERSDKPLGASRLRLQCDPSRPGRLVLSPAL